VIHLRTGDAVVHSWFLKKPYLKLIQDSVDKYNIKRVTFVTSFHYGNNKLTNGKTIIFQYNHNKQKKNIDKLTDLFKNIVLKFPFLKFDVLSSKDIDQDFVYMCTANHFISDKGGFSELITIVQNEVKIRRRKRILFKS